MEGWSLGTTKRIRAGALRRAGAGETSLKWDASGPVDIEAGEEIGDFPAKCKMQLICQPNCELVEFCAPNQFGEAGFDCQDTIWGCNLGARCLWVDLHKSSPAPAPFQVADSCKLSAS